MLYVFVINVRPGVSLTDVQKRFGKMPWYRIAPNVWIAKTNAEPREWADHLNVLVEPGGTLFISRLDTHAVQGWMDESFWAWFNLRR